MLRFAVTIALCLVSVSADAMGRHTRTGKPPAHGTRRAEVPIDAATVNDPRLAEVVGPGARGAAVLRAQILLARAHFSCGEIDGRYGVNLRGAIADFQTAHGLEGTGTVGQETWQVLNADTAPALIRVAIAPEDVAGPFVPVPEDMMEKAKLPALSYSSPLEGIAEKYHACPALLRKLNPGGKTQSHGCIRMTNWDVTELSAMVGPGTPAILEE